MWHCSAVVLCWGGNEEPLFFFSLFFSCVSELRTCLYAYVWALSCFFPEKLCDRPVRLNWLGNKSTKGGWTWTLTKGGGPLSCLLQSRAASSGKGRGKETLEKLCVCVSVVCVVCVCARVCVPDTWERMLRFVHCTEIYLDWDKQCRGVDSAAWVGSGCVPTTVCVSRIGHVMLCKPLWWD